jgi:hypothetical protein
MRRFTALKDFHSDVFRCDYCAGLSYTVRDGNDKLAAEASKWEAEGLIEFTPETGRKAGAGSSGAAGRGTVS